eukprot:scaffold15265_cov61-Phaeocystis_antarctica.AAC.3
MARRSQRWRRVAGPRSRAGSRSRSTSRRQAGWAAAARCNANGEGRHANACEYDAAPRRDDGGVASRRQTRCGSGAGRRGARRGGPEAHGRTWVGVVSLMRGAR